MILLTQANAIFCHIPKCGGTFVETALRRLGIEHTTAPTSNGVSRRHDQPRHCKCKPSHWFAFLREPAEWYVSWWRFQEKNGWRDWEPDRWHPCRPLPRRAAGEAFAAWLARTLDACPGWLSQLYADTLDYPGREVRLVGQQERLAGDLAHILSGLDYGVTASQIAALPRENESGTARPALPEELRQRIVAAEADAMSRWMNL